MIWGLSNCLSKLSSVLRSCSISLFNRLRKTDLHAYSCPVVLCLITYTDPLIPDPNFLFVFSYLDQILSPLCSSTRWYFIVWDPSFMGDKRVLSLLSGATLFVGDSGAEHIPPIVSESILCVDGRHRERGGMERMREDQNNPMLLLFCKRMIFFPQKPKADRKTPFAQYTIWNFSVFMFGFHSAYKKQGSGDPTKGKKRKK